MTSLSRISHLRKFDSRDYYHIFTISHTKHLQLSLETVSILHVGSIFKLFINLFYCQNIYHQQHLTNYCMNGNFPYYGYY